MSPLESLLPGDQVTITSPLKGDSAPLNTGDKGVVVTVEVTDGIHQVLVQWTMGFSARLLPEDSFTVKRNKN